MTKPHNDFDVGKAIHDLLEPLNDDRRRRILRWVSESLGLQAAPLKTPPTTSAPAPSKTANAVATPQHAPSSDPPVDIKSFVESKSPKSDQQFAAVVAYYYRFQAPDEKRKPTIDTETLQDATRLAGRTRLTKPNATLNNAKASGYLNSSTPGEFEISTVGENLVAMTLPSSSGDPKPKKNSTRKKSGKKKSTKKAKSKKTTKKSK